jgi:hypothetical protein
MGERGDVLSGAPGVTPEEARDAARKLGRRETLLVAWTVLKELYEEWDFTIPWERWRRLRTWARHLEAVADVDEEEWRKPKLEKIEEAGG